MKNKEDIINKLIEENNCKSYLELGFGDGYNFNKIKCDKKVSVDINGNAEFNKGDLDFLKENEDDFDFVFLDSEHIAEHVRKVIIEVLKINPVIIAIHDVLPQSKEMQEVPRKTKQFTGDVYKAVVGFIQEYPEVKVETYISDFGLSVLYPEGKRVRKAFEDTDITYEEFKENEKEYLNIID